MNTKNTSWTLHRLRRGIFAAVFGLCGFASPLAAQKPGRAAILLPPQPAAAHEVRTIARGAIDDAIGVDPLATTPVPRKTAPVPGPVWLSRTDSAVKPAGAKGLTTTFTVPETKPFFGRLDGVPESPSKPSFFERGLEKLRTTFADDSPDSRFEPLPSSLPPMPMMPRTTVSRTVAPPSEGWGVPPREMTMPVREVPSASSPLQGMLPSGTPVLAGPPAYRWYGYGTTTPGANPHSPSGQYPKASANWYSLTGATPGAFPTLVSGNEAGAGVDPPSYRPPTITRISTLPPESVQTMPAPPKPMMPAFISREEVLTPKPTMPTMPTYTVRDEVVPPKPTMPTYTVREEVVPPKPAMPSFTVKEVVPPPAPFVPSLPAPVAMPAPPAPAMLPTAPVLIPPPPAPIVIQSAPAPIEIQSAPAPAPAPIVIKPAPAPIVIKPAPAPIVIQSAPAPAPVSMPALPPAPSSKPSTPPLLPMLPDGKSISKAIPKLESSEPALASATLPRVPELPQPSTDPAPLPPLSLTPIAPLDIPPRPAPAADEMPWKSAPDRGETTEPWMPSDGIPRQQSRSSDVPATDVHWNRQAQAAPRIIVRAQAPDERPDPIATLVHSLLRGRADGVDVRWNGEKKLMICFEASTRDDAGRIVKDLSARPELAPLQVDFCVVVK